MGRFLYKKLLNLHHYHCMFGLKGPNMEIASLKLQNHPILHDLELNFCDENGKPYKNIVFAGENGTGKTALLNLLHNITAQMHNFLLTRPSFDFEIKCILTSKEFDLVKSFLGEPRVSIVRNLDNKTFVLQYKHTEDDSYNNYVVYLSGEKHPYPAIMNRVSSVFHSIHSKVGMNFETQAIRSITASQIDSLEDLGPRHTNKDIAMLFKQLLIDISVQDNQYLSDWIDVHDGCVPPNEVKHVKLSRFTDAFNKMFQSINFHGIVADGNQQQVMFMKNGKQVRLEELSSGEKQIVFRGGFLLKNMGVLDGSIVLIDEPEISMHPRWQSKIFSFYSDLFKTETEQKSQIFFATHSEYVLKDAMDKKAQIIVLTEQENTVKAESVNNKFVLPFGPTYAEIRYFAFNIPTIEFHDELYGYIQEKNGREKENEMEEFLKTNDVKQEKLWSRLKDGVFKSAQKLTLMTYIRNFYHHPEASRNERNLLHPLEPSDEEMRQSIDCMINILQG